MNIKRLFILLLITLSVSAYSAEQTSSEMQQEAHASGSATQSVDVEENPSYMVFHDQIEGTVYSDSWYAYLIDHSRFLDRHMLFVMRDGKSGDFSALLSLSCKDKTVRWQWGIRYGSQVVEDSFFKNDIVQEVVKGIIKKYCN